MLRLHFLNVGHGDCTIVEFPSGRLAMIDINNSKSLDDTTASELKSLYQINQIVSTASAQELLAERGYKIQLTDPVDYYKREFRNNHIFRFICTHPDMDHISGLFRLYNEECIPITNFWDSDNSITKESLDFSGTKYDDRDWKTYRKLHSSQNNPKSINLERSAEGEFYSDDGISILAPTKELIRKANTSGNSNLLSYVIKIQYGRSRIILGGDAPEEVWEDILDNCSPEIEVSATFCV